MKKFYNTLLNNFIRRFKYFLFTILFLFLNIVLSGVLTNNKIDLTYDKLYTVSDNTKEIIKNLNEPIKIQFFFSNSLSKDIPQIRDYERRVRELLYNYINISNNNIKLEIIDPKPFTDEEDLASIYGIEGLQLNEEGERFYFGAVISNSVDDTIVIPFFDLGRERFLEYDLTKSIYNLANTSKPTIGLITGLPFIGTVRNGPQGPQYDEPFYLYSRISEFFNVEDLSNSINNISEEIDQLLIIHPKKLGDEALYAIDQFVMSGKGVTFFVDPFSEFEKNNQSPENSNLNIPSSNLERLFNNWGFSVKPGMIVGDIVNGRKVSLGTPNNQRIATYLLWLAVQNKDLSRSDIITSNLDYIFLKSSGLIESLNTNKSLEIKPLINTSKDTMLIERYKMQFRADPDELLKNFISEEESRILGGRVTGNLKSAFSRDQISNLDTDISKYIQKKDNVNILVYADTDFLTDDTWVSQQDMFGRNNVTPIADNGRLVINSLESMSGGSNLIGLRGRGVSNRPFVVIENLQKNAELTFREKELSLKNKLENTEKKLNEIQSKKSDTIDTKASEQNKAIEDFRNKIYNIRKELREVQRKLNSDIDNLETNIKLINIWLMPVIVFILYFIIITTSSRRRNEFNKKIGRFTR